MKRISLITAVPLVALACTVPSSVSAQTAQPVDALVVIDATGKKVGNVLGLAGQDDARVGFTVNGRAFLVNVDSSGFFGPCDFSYTSADCSGTPYNSSQTAVLSQQGCIGGPGITVYLPDPSANSQEITVMSRKSEGACLTIQTPYLMPYLVPYVPVSDLSQQFTPPLRIVPAASGSAAACCGDCNGNGQVTVDEILMAVNHALNGC